MATGFSYDGKVVSVGDSVTIMGRVASHTSSGPTATVTTTTHLGDSISHKANVANGPHSQTGITPLQSLNAKGYSDGDQISLPGFVTAISGSGNQATLTVQLIDGTTVTVSAGACRSTSKV